MQLFLRLTLLVMACVAGGLSAIMCFFGLAYLLPYPYLFGLVSIVVVGVATGYLAYMVFRGTQIRQKICMFMAIIMILLGLLLGIAMYKPREFPQKPGAFTDLQYADLYTGSRIAYKLYKDSSVAKRGGILFLHGGPGSNAATNYSVRNAMRPFTKLGFDVCVYDQVGSGFSSRLNPVEYTPERHVADLEALRQYLGWERLVLIGESWGAQFLARYAAKFPERVAAAVFVSPGPLFMPDWEEKSAGSPSKHLDPAERRVLENLIDIRLMVAILLLKVNPTAAIRFLPEEEATQYGSAILGALSPGAVCDDRVLTEDYQPFLNIYASHMVMGCLKREPQTLKKDFGRGDFPVLVLRGDCDYGHMELSTEYTNVFRDSSLVTLKNTGHFMLLENPEGFFDSVALFLEDKTKR